MKLAYSIQQAAEAIGMSEGFIKKEIREGRLARRKFGRRSFIEVDELQAWVKRQPVKNVVNAADSGQSPADGDKNQVIEKTFGVRR